MSLSSIAPPVRAPARPTAGSTWGDRLFVSLAALSLAFIAFVGGATVMLTEVFPSKWLSDVYIGSRALMEKSAQDQSKHTTDFWAPERTAESGVTHHAPGRAFNGHTLYTSGDAARAELIDMDGTRLHAWSKPFSEVYDETAAVKSPQPDHLMYWRKAEVYPNGDLLAIYVAAGDSPWGYGMVRLDQDSNVRWKFLEQTHHDFDTRPDGTVYALTHKVRFNELKGFEHLKPPRMDDFVIVLGPDGEVRKRVSIIDAFTASNYSRLLSRVVWYTKGDFIHTNAIEYLDADKAAVLPFAEEGQVMISFREIDTIAVLDLDKEAIVWALRGPWLGQHDPDVLPNGNIMLFDNMGHYGEGGRSRVLEFNPNTVEIAWQYNGTQEQPFDSDVRAAQEQLPNGNVLITESTGGRIFEVTRDRDVVWEFVNPVRARHPQTGAAIVPIVSWAQRVAPDVIDESVLKP